LPAKGASKNFSIERLVLLPGMMTMTSLATVVALRWLAGASTKLTAAATCAAKRGSVNRAHSAHSPTLKGRLGPKSTVLSAFDHVIREDIPFLLKNLHPACRVISGVEGSKKDRLEHA
jgi:hypothetical protein